MFRQASLGIFVLAASTLFAEPLPRTGPYAERTSINVLSGSLESVLAMAQPNTVEALRTSPNLLPRKVTVLVNETPKYQILEELARALELQWIKSGETYVLSPINRMVRKENSHLDKRRKEFNVFLEAYLREPARPPALLEASSAILNSPPTRGTWSSLKTAHGEVTYQLYPEHGFAHFKVDQNGKSQWFDALLSDFKTLEPYSEIWRNRQGVVAIIQSLSTTGSDTEILKQIHQKTGTNVYAEDWGTRDLVNNLAQAFISIDGGNLIFRSIESATLRLVTLPVYETDLLVPQSFPEHAALYGALASEFKIQAPLNSGQWSPQRGRIVQGLALLSKKSISDLLGGRPIELNAESDRIALQLLFSQLDLSPKAKLSLSANKLRDNGVFWLEFKLVDADGKVIATERVYAPQ